MLGKGDSLGLSYQGWGSLRQNDHGVISEFFFIVCCPSIQLLCNQIHNYYTKLQQYRQRMQPQQPPIRTPPHSLRLLLLFSPGLYLTQIGNTLHLLSHPSYLQLPNCLQLQQVNTSNTQQLKIGQSFYIYFPFSQHYLAYELDNNMLYLSKDAKDRCAFKIIVEEFKWSTRGEIQLGDKFLYRIVLAEANSRHLVSREGKIGVDYTGENRDSGLISLRECLYDVTYNPNTLRYNKQGKIICKLIDLQNNLSLCYRDKKTSCHIKPSVCEYMLQLQTKTIREKIGRTQQKVYLSGIKHINSGNYLIKSGKQYVFFNDAPTNYRYCLKYTPYSEKEVSYTQLQTLDNNYLHLTHQGCQITTNPLQSIFYACSISQVELKNILLSCWFKCQLGLPNNNQTIMYVLEECEIVVRKMAEVYQFQWVETLLEEGLLQDFQKLCQKYEWGIIGGRISEIVAVLLMMKDNWLCRLFAVPRLYNSVMGDNQVANIVQEIRLYPQVLVEYPSLLPSLHALVFGQKNISLTILKTLLVVSPVLLSPLSLTIDLAKQYQLFYEQLKQYLQYCSTKLTPQVQSLNLSSYFTLGVKLLKTTSTQAYFTNQIISKLSLNLCAQSALSLSQKLTIIRTFEQESPPYAYIVTEDQSVRLVATDKKHQPLLSDYIENIFPKNPRFQQYEPKLLSIVCMGFWIRNNHILDYNDFKQSMKYLLENIVNYYYQQNPDLYIQCCVEDAALIIKRLYLLCVSRSLQFDGGVQDGTMESRVQKCQKQIQAMINEKTLNIPVVWQLFKNPNPTLKQLQIFLKTIQITQQIIHPQKQLTHYFRILKYMEQPSAHLIKSISLFLQRQHSFNPKLASQKLIEQFRYMDLEELSVIATMIDQNSMYEKICWKTEVFYDIINTFQVMENPEKEQKHKHNQQQSVSYMPKQKHEQQPKPQHNNFGKLLNGPLILQTLVRRPSQWLHTQSQFKFMKNLLHLIGGVVSTQIYNNYQKYICSVQAQKWSLYYFTLCEVFFNMSPVALKKKFVIKYHEEIISKDYELERLFLKKGAYFIIAYIKLLLAFSSYHSSKDLIYEIIGDQTLFALLFKFHKYIELRIKILQLMIASRKRYNEYQTISSSPKNLQFLKKGTQFIRDKLNKTKQSQSQSNKIQQKELQHIKQYTIALIDFLEMRQQITLHTQVMEDDALVVQGTNKIFAFKLAQLIGVMVKSQKIERNVFDKIQWFEEQYKIGIDIIQLTQISVELEKEEEVNENFVYNYMLVISPEIQPTVKTLLKKLDISIIVTTLIKLILTLSHKKSPSYTDLQLCLSYLHFIVSSYSYPFLQKDLSLLFLSMLKLIRNKKINLVALTQNIIRKIVLKDGQLQVKYQRTVQEYFIKYKTDMFVFLKQCTTNYMTFSPLYESTLNYFNVNGQNSICWTVSCYISMLRFLISLCKTLDLEFKSIFSESENFQKQLMGTIIQINRQHLKQLFRDTSDAKLTIIAYQIQLINNMMLGPVETNIRTALKFKYQQIIQLINLPDRHEDPNRLKTFKIIIQIKKYVTQGLLILSNFHRLKPQDILKIQQGLIAYFWTTKKLVKDNMNSLIDKYTKQNKQKLEVMNFDLALSLYFCILKIYEMEENNTLKRMKTDALREMRLVKSYNKKFKMFYQIYRILSDIFGTIARFGVRCCKKTTNKIDEVIFGEQQKTHQQNLHEVFQFFVKNVSCVQIQIGKELQTVHFLLLKQTQCYNTSIRKDLHRKVGLGQRQYKMLRFVSHIDYVILRLQIQKKIKQWTQRYKPIQIIIKNRQLWKSLNFFCACLLNLLFLDQDNIANQPIVMIVLRSLSYLFCIFLFMIYFIQNLPLKRRLSQQMSKSDKPQKFKKIKACLEIFNDKTLWFATIYFLVISLSIYQQGFVAILMIDFFVRFKISKKVTQIVTRPMMQLLLIVLVSVQIAFVFTYYLYFLGDQVNCKDAPTCIQQTYFEYLGLPKNLVIENQINSLQFRNIVEFFATFFAIMINNSLIISVLLYEKKAKDIKKADWEFKVKERCFICDNQRNTIDRARNNNKGFFQHIQEEHNLWSYIYYLIYLKNKELDSLNIVENMVMNEWKNHKIDWLPTNFKA